jgi:hypothetical protein
MSDTNNALEIHPPAQLAQYQEQNVSMVQQYATARIQSAYTMALRNPRDNRIESIRQNVLRECQRPSFCAPDEAKYGSSLAIYAVPRGKVQVNGKWVDNLIQGPTIRFAEMLLREWGFLSIEVNPMGETDDYKLLQVICTDYQACNFTSEIVSVPKSVERKKQRGDDELISQRTNSYGDPVYLVKATDDEIAMKTNALVSKARRNLILQAVPGWLIEEAIVKVRETARDKDAKDPAAAKRKLFDAFSTVGVSAQQLTEVIGHGNDLSPAELEDLRGYFSGIKEGYTTWAAIIAAKEEHKDDDGTASAIAAAFETLELPVAQVRKIKAKHIGKDADLLKWLQGEVAKKQNTGAKQEPSVSDPTSTATQQNHGTAGSQTGGSSSVKKTESQTNSTISSSAKNTSTDENEDSDPPQDTKKPAPTKQTSRPAAIPFEDDEEF